MFEQYKVNSTAADTPISKSELTAIVEKAVNQQMAELLETMKQFVETSEKFADFVERRTAEKTSLKHHENEFLSWLAPDPGRSSTKSIDRVNGTGNPHSDFTGWLSRSV